MDEVNAPEAIDGQTNLLTQTANSMGVSEDEVLALFDLGYDPCATEERLYNYFLKAHQLSACAMEWMTGCERCADSLRRVQL